MTERKAIFFDIDGTLWDYHNFIPESTKRAIHELQRAGHAVFLNTGRTRGFVRNPELLDIGFDGIVSGCGTMIEYQGDVPFYYAMDRDFSIRTVETVKKYGFKPILEGRKYLYFDQEDFEGDAYGFKVFTEMEGDLLSIQDNWGEWEISKLSCDTGEGDCENCYKNLADEFDLIIHNEKVCELVPKGFTKGTGIHKVCEILNIPVENTVAFGDSANDLEMFRAAGTAVAMGDGAQEAKDTADYVTDPLLEDGIWNACVKLGLIAG